MIFGLRTRLNASSGCIAASPDRVVSLVAMGGTGKTALAERVLSDLGDQPAAGLLCWSFYEDPRTEAFLDPINLWLDEVGQHAG